MKSISKLKDEARRHEQREEWEKAIQAYLQVLRTADEGETEVELPLYNRVGDLCVRLGKPQEAVRHYEQAADRYAEAGLYNNAIALCNKALRYSPDRLELIRKLGQFSASQGFITDARRYFLDYAERQFKAGKVTEALSALEDFANVSDDAEIREMLGRQLKAHGRINDAVDELRRAHALRLRDGQTDHAETLRAEILAIDPHATISGGAAAPAGARPSTSVELPGLVDIEPDLPAAEEPPVEERREPDATGVEGLETGALPGDDSSGMEPIELAGFETTGGSGLADIDVSAGVEGLETTAFDFGEIAEAPAMEDLGLEPELTSFDGPTASEADAFDLPTLDDPSTAFDLPTLDDSANAFDLPTLDDPADSLDLPLLGDSAIDESGTLPRLDEPEVFDLPPLDAPDDVFELPTLDEPSGDLDLPSRGDPAEDFDLPTLDDTDAFELPAGEDSPGTDAPAPDEPRPSGVPSFGDADGGIDLPLDADALPQDGDAAADSGDTDFDLGGDLPLDLSSLGSSAFDLPASDEADADVPEWKSDEPAFEVPELDGEALGLPTWEPEPDQTFDLPSFDTDDADDADAPAEIADAEPDPAPPAGDVPAADAALDAEALRIPAIELPTWGTGITLGADDGTEAVEEDEPVEPAWVDSITDEDDEASPELPTFTYEEDVEAIVDEDVAAEDFLADAVDDAPSGEPVSGDDVEVEPLRPEPADDVAADEDPLGLAAHLATIQGTDVPMEPAAGVGESDWLDDIADDDDSAAAEEAVEEPVDLDSSLDTATDEPVAEPAAEAVAEVEDAGAAAAMAEAAAREMAAEAAAREMAAEAAARELAAEAAAREMAAEAAAREMAAEAAARELAADAAARELAAQAAPPSEDYVDLAALVTADDDEETTRFRVQETAPTGDEDRDFAELLTQFKSKVHEHLPPEDAAAHYDLGLAFKEMGLIDEAIGEFQVALRAGHMRLKVYEELGQCFLQKEQFNIAEKVLNRALAMKFEDELELLGVYYHLGRTYEALGRRDQARDAYERVLGMDINFGDVTDRLARL